MTTQPKKFSVNKEASISLINFQVVKLQFDIPKHNYGNNQVSNDCNLSINFTTLKVDKDDSLFALQFVVKLTNDENGFSLNVESYAEFKTTGLKVTSEFIKSEIVTGNASAIVFPYLRMYITNFCQNSGFNPIIIPGFNFTQIVPVED